MTRYEPLASPQAATRLRGAGLRRWHRWVGLAALAVLLVAALSGAALVFQKPLVR